MSDGHNTLTVLLWEASAKHGREADMKAFMSKAVTASRHDEGCIDYEAHEVAGQPGKFVIYERWVSREALEAHLHAPRMAELVPQLLEMMDGTIEAGIRFLEPFRPAN